MSFNVVILAALVAISVSLELMLVLLVLILDSTSVKSPTAKVPDTVASDKVVAPVTANVELSVVAPLTLKASDKVVAPVTSRVVPIVASLLILKYELERVPLTERFPDTDAPPPKVVNPETVSASDKVVAPETDRADARDVVPATAKSLSTSTVPDVCPRYNWPVEKLPDINWSVVELPFAIHKTLSLASQSAL